MNLQIDPMRSINEMSTGIYVRAQTSDGNWKSADICELKRESLLAWLQDKTPEYRLNIILMLLGHEAEK